MYKLRRLILMDNGVRVNDAMPTDFNPM